MDELFAVDAEARRRRIDFTRRHALRQERAKPILDDIRTKIETAQHHALPSSALSKACQYALTLWRKLTRFLEHPELELSNNLAENSMRPVALGRKNWIHIGSPQAGPKVAAILSVVESCRRLKIRVRDYLAAILPASPISRSSAFRHLRPLYGAAPQRHGWDGEGWLTEARSFALRDSSSRPRS
jgi:transposase